MKYINLSYICGMKLIEYLQKTYKEGEIFFLDDIVSTNVNVQSVLVQLCGLIKRGSIRRLYKGMYYIPVVSELFGELYVSKEEIIKAFCKRTDGYVSGESVYNKFHLTEQVPNLVTIACKRKYPEINVQGIRINFIKNRVSPTGKDTFVLQILDCLDNLDGIAGTDQDTAFFRINTLVRSLNGRQMEKLVDYSLFFSSATRYKLSKITEGETRNAVLKSINKLTRMGYENK